MCCFSVARMLSPGGQGLAYGTDRDGARAAAMVLPLPEQAMLHRTLPARLANEDTWISV